ncbi:MAG TPA: hypothetical protein VHO67_13260 [Polyangia bacterium]|nr:hypothetical protein [Polyangia bacterium]
MKPTRRLLNGARVLVGGGTLFWLAPAGCGSGQPAKADASSATPQFAVCAGVDAGPYMPGLVFSSRSGAWNATVLSVLTTSADAPPVDAPAVGLSTFRLAIADASGQPPVAVSLTAEKPYMPFHGHSASIVPQVAAGADGAGGTFTISNISFFMTGVFELGLDLQFSASAASDRIVLTVCVPS